MPVIIPAAAGALKMGVGLIQRGSANKWLKNNQEPTESMSSEIKRNQELANIRANTGLPSAQYNNAMKNIQRQQLLALRGASMQGGGKALGLLGGINQQGNDAVGDLDARDAEMRLNNEGQLMNVNNQVAGWKSKLFDSNVRQKWMRQYQQKMGELGAGNTNIFNGIDSIGAAGMQIGAGSGSSGTGSNGQTPSFGQYDQMQTNLPNVNTGNSPASTFGNIPFNPARAYRINGLVNYNNRPR